MSVSRRTRSSCCACTACSRIPTSDLFKDREGRFLLVSAGVLATYGQQCKPRGFDRDEGFGLLHWAHAEAALADEQRVMETGEAMLAKVERETFHDRPDAWAHTTKRPLRDDDGNVVGTWGIARDVTAQ